jgi:hypothetical protein
MAMAKTKQNPKTKSSAQIKWGEILNGVRQFPCHAGQMEILNSEAKITAGIAGTGSGKTVLIPLWLVKHIQKFADRPYQRHLVVSPTFAIHKQSRLLDTWREVVQGTELDGTYNAADHIFKCKDFNVEVFFKSADIANSLDGGVFDTVSFDEVAKISWDSYVKGCARAGKLNGPILCVGTPDLNNFYYTEIFKPCSVLVSQKDGLTVRQSPDGQIKCVQFGSILNPTYSRDEIERQRLVLPEGLFRRRYMGEFANIEGMIYQMEPHILDESCPDILPVPAVRVCGGVDFGYNDPCVIHVGVECQDGKIYIVDEIYETEMTVDMIRQNLTALRRKWNVELFFCDSSRPEIVQTLRTYGLPVVTKRVANIETGILMVQSRLKQGYLKIYKNCTNLIEEAKYYQRKSLKDGNYSEQPVDKNNHAMDAFRYLISGMDYGRELRFEALEPTPEDTTLKAKIRLAIVSPDETIRKQQEKKQDEDRAKKHFQDLLMADM